MNNLTILKFNTKNKNFVEQAFTIRKSVFVDEQKVDPAIEYENEDEAIHYLALLNNIPVATARWRKTNEGIKLERFATLKEFRNKGIGAELLKKILEDVIPVSQIIYLNSQLPAIPFYEKYGFHKTGALFYEANIAHYKMKY